MPSTLPPTRFAKRALIAAAIAVALVIVLLVGRTAINIFFLFFAGILLATLLCGLAQWTQKYAPVPYGLSLTLVLLLLAALFIGGAWFLADRVAEQMDELVARLRDSIEQLERRLDEHTWGQWLLEQVPRGQEWSSYLGRVATAFTATVGILADVVVFLFLGLYLAVDPGWYRRGLIRLMPLAKRERAGEVLDDVTGVMRGWLVAKLASMLLIGILTTIGLQLLSIPLALTLGLIAALLTFVPNFGPLISAVPALLLALTVGPWYVLYVALLYAGLQTVESYLITPLLQQRTVDLPPALTIGSQVLLGVLVGPLGLALAAPVTAVTIVLVKRLYVEDVLGDHGEG